MLQENEKKKSLNTIPWREFTKTKLTHLTTLPKCKRSQAEMAILKSKEFWSFFFFFKWLIITRQHASSIHV